MSEFIHIVTEGVHDVAFLGKLLTHALGFGAVVDPRKLDKEWKKLTDLKFPHENSLRAAMPVPRFFKKGEASVAIAIGDGSDEKVCKRLRTNYEVLEDDGVTLSGVGIVLDADYTRQGQKPPAARFADMAKLLTDLRLPAPAKVGTVDGAPRTGIYIMPGEGSLGTLEDILLDCASTAYPTLGCRAVRFIDGLDLTASDFVGKDLDEIRAPAGRHKAVLAAMGAVLKPGKAIQVSIEDHRWIEPRTLILPRVAALLRFLSALIGMPIA